MLLLWILGAILLLLFLLAMARLRLHITMGENAAAEVRFAFFRVRLYPPPERRRRRPSGEREEPEERRTPRLPPVTLADARDALHTLPGPLYRAFLWLIRGVRVHPLQLELIVGGREDPASAAQAYGYANAAVWTVMPLLEQTLSIPDPKIDLGVDFDAEQTVVRGEVAVSARVWRLAAAGTCAAVPAVRWLGRYARRSARRRGAEKKAEPDEDAEKPSADGQSADGQSADGQSADGQSADGQSGADGGSGKTA